MRNTRVTQPAWSSTRRRGFTMAEMVVAVTIMVVVTAVVASLFVQVRKMIGITQWGAETRTELRSTVNTLAADLLNINSKAYFIMLNRDYGWDAAQVPSLSSVTPAAAGAVLYKGDVDTATHYLWADRLAFVADGPFNTLQGQQVGGVPATATTARVYYGHSLWTHELTDMVWTTLPTGALFPMTGTLDPFIRQPVASPTGLGPCQMGTWPNDIRQRPAVDWTLCRRAILHVEDPAADGPDGASAWVSGQQLFVGASREIDWRTAVDSEYAFLFSTLNSYTLDDLARVVDSQVAPTSKDWFVPLLPPRIDAPPATVLKDPTVMARSRILLQHAARVRFQVRLNDGTIVPRIDDTPVDPRQRGALAGIATTGSVTSWMPDFSLPNPPTTFTTLDPAAATDSVHNAAGTPQVPVKQMAYLWTATQSNLQPTPTLYPVALRVRIDVYDPDKRTPDPIRVDEWLPIRWR